MADCNEYVLSIYKNKDINTLISKIKPVDLQDDLRQEIAVNLLSMPCEKVAALFVSDNLLKYAIKMCWVMSTSPRSTFCSQYKKRDIAKAVDYFRSLQPLPSIPVSVAVTAKQILDSKNKDIYEDHEARIFNKYVELGSGREVARFYNIPVNHVCAIVSKVKKELRCMLSQ
jgi:hypothetical protein